MKNRMIKACVYPAVFILCVLVFVFSFTTLTDNGDRYAKTAAFDVEKTYATVETLAKETRPRTSEAHLNALEYLKTTMTGYGAAVIEMDYVTDYEDVINYGGYGGKNTLVPDTLVKNLLVEFKGTQSDDVLILQAHTDSVPMGSGAYDDAVPVASMVECIRWITKNNIQFKNTVVFLFTDGEEEGLLGARMFASKRATHNTVDQRYINLMDKTKFVLNFEARGTGGTLIMFETTKGNYNSVKNFAKINKDIYTNSIANFVYNQMPNGTDFSAFSNKGVQGLNIANIGEGMNYHTKFDNIDNINKSVIAQNGRIMQSALKHFGNTGLDEMYKIKENAVFFSYLNIFTMYYPQWLAIAFGVVTLLLLAGAAILNIRNKKYSFKSFLFALLTNIIALAGAVLCVFLIKTLFGLIPALGKVLTSPSYNNYLVMFGYLFIMVAVYTALSCLFNKIFKTGNPEYNMLANCTFIAFLGSILSFAMPELSFILAAPGFLGAAIICLSVSLKKINFNPYILGVVPFIMMLPFGISIAVLASDALGLTLAWIAVIVPLLAFAYIIPYLITFGNFLKGVSENLKKDTAAVKTIKFSMSKSRYLIAAIALVTGLVMFFCGAAAPLGIATNIYGKASGRYMLFVDDAVIYDKNLDSGEGRFVVYDDSAFEYLQKNYGLKAVYDNAVKGYVLDLNGTVQTAAPEITVSKEQGYFEINVEKAMDGMFTLSFPLINDDTHISKIEVVDSFGTYIFEKADFIENMKSSGEIKFRSYSDSVIKIYTSSPSLNFNYKENANVNYTSVEKINNIKSNEKHFVTGIQLNKAFSV